MQEQIGHYKIVAELGRGGMGVVYKAHEQSLNRLVALKVLGKHLSEDQTFVERFKREAQSAAGLNHPNIVQVYSIDEFDGQHCFAMEFVSGVSIQQMIKSQGSLDPVAAGRLILQAASGLRAAHEQNIIHRDIKPANLMVDDRGLVKIADFGLALLAVGTTRLTATGMFMGTPGYLSPEQCLDEDIDQRTDIYSLGVTLYEMLTGVTPLSADSPLALLRQIIDVEPKDVGELKPEVPEALRVILRKMMAKNPQSRYADCAALISDLQSWLEHAGSSRSDISAAIAASVSAPSSGGNSEATVIASSEDMAARKVGASSSSKSRRMSASWLTAVIVTLVTVVGVAALKFGVTEDTTISVAGDKPVETQEATGLPEAEPELITAVESAELSLASQLSTASEIPAEDPQEPVFEAEASFAEVSEAESGYVATQPNINETQESHVAETLAAATPQVPPEPVIGTGVALVSIGEVLLADTTADYVRQMLERRGVTVRNGMAVAGVASTLENGGGAIEDLLRPYARYLVFIRADFTGERELQYMGRYETEYQARLTLETHDLRDGKSFGSGIHANVGYTRLSVENKVADLIRPEFGPIAGELAE